jgi:hypothetical protein
VRIVDAHDGLEILDEYRLRQRDYTVALFLARCADFGSWSNGDDGFVPLCVIGHAELSLEAR